MAQVENAKSVDTQLPKISNDLALPSYDWRVSISFSQSRSANFARALYLAKQSPQYLELDEAGEPVYQATYSADPKEFLSFVRLYEMISSWKSAHVMINGHLTDRKIVGNINYCYGDRCRSGNPDFCFGASFFTMNPFGCHRLQMSACNTPWTDFFIPTADGTYHLDRCKMKRRIDYQGQFYSRCPAFDYDSIIKRLNSLPNAVSEEEYNKLSQQNGHFGRINIGFRY